MDTDYAAIRGGFANLPRADNHTPGQPVDPKAVLAVPGHRAALDSARPLVVANRGMGKSFWAHALLQEEVRRMAASQFRQPELLSMSVVMGFNASERSEEVAPPTDTVRHAFQQAADPEGVWQAVVARAVSNVCQAPIPAGFLDLVHWVASDPERYARMMTKADQTLAASGRRLLVVFDALDRLGRDWATTRKLTRGLLQRALAAKSYRAIALKLFMRTDQYEDQSLFEFPDASKLRNTRVVLEWSTTDLYGLLFDRLRRSAEAGSAFPALEERCRRLAAAPSLLEQGPPSDTKAIVDAIAGEFMGKGERRGRVFTWVPTHLADARGETSPRTFLTAWREAALHASGSTARVIDHLGILEGVRKASEDRLSELKEDHPWISAVLEPLRDQMVPMEQAVVQNLWKDRGTAETVRMDADQNRWLAPVQLDDPRRSPEQSLISALAAIGVVEIRGNGKVNVPDIFRVEAGIKRKGGVKPPRRGNSGATSPNSGGS